MSIARSMLWSMSGQGVSTVLSMAGTIVLARILTPAETGAFAFSIAMFALVYSLLQFGMGNYILRAAKLTPALANTATTVAVAQGVIAALLMAIAAPAAGLISGDSQITWLSLVVATAPLFSGPEAICQAIWARNTHFGAIALMTAMKTLVQVAISVAAGLHGWGAFALAAGFAGSAVFACVWGSYQIFVRDGIRLRVDRQEWALLKSYSISSMFLTVTVTMNGRLPDIFIGRMFTIASLGQYSRASGTVDMLRRSVSTPTARVFMPRMMDEMNAGAPVDKSVGDMRDAFLFVMWPALAGLAVLSEPLTLLLYGDQWEIAGRVLQVLCFAEAFRVARSGAMELLLFRDKLKLNNKIEAVFLFTNIGLFFSALPFGLMAVIWSRVAEMAFEFMLYGWVLHRSEKIALTRYVRNYLIHGGLAFVAVVPALALMMGEGWPRRLLFGEMLLVVAAGVALWAVTALMIGHPAARAGKRALINLRARLR